LASTARNYCSDREPRIVNAVFIISASPSANVKLYIGSRYLFALAQQARHQRYSFDATNRASHIFAVITTGAIGILVFMTVSSGGAKVFQWFEVITAVACVIA
jgi:amino acid transporter